MISEMKILKENRWGRKSEASTQQHRLTVSLKNMLTTLGDRIPDAQEPLSASLTEFTTLTEDDLECSAERSEAPKIEALNRQFRAGDDNFKNIKTEQETLIELAKQEKMNTNVRQSIFVAIMSANDYCDAHFRLLRLNLCKSQQLEIPKVLSHCAMIEDTYNRYYSLVAERLCGQRHTSKAFEFTLRDELKRLVKPHRQSLRLASASTRAVLNLSRLYGYLAATECLSILVLKVIVSPQVDWYSPKALVLILSRGFDGGVLIVSWNCSQSFSLPQYF